MTSGSTATSPSRCSAATCPGPGVPGPLPPRGTVRGLAEPAVVVAVYDTGTEDKHDPPALHRHGVRRGPYPARAAARRAAHPAAGIEIVDGVLRALDYSHRAGIVHRDIKPGNVMITRDGGQGHGLRHRASDRPTTATVTQTAAVMGTAQYLSPEQARGEKVDARSDLYSTGACSTSCSPGSRRSRAIHRSPLPISTCGRTRFPLGSRTPSWATSIVVKALAKNPANRYQTAAEMADDLSAPPPAARHFIQMKTVPGSWRGRLRAQRHYWTWRNG